VTTRDALPDCAAPLIGRKVWRERGAVALRREGSGFVMESAPPDGFDRRWSPQRARTAATANADTAPSAAEAPRAPPRDATPRSEDLQPDD
jgi:competence protein ComEC